MAPTAGPLERCSHGPELDRSAKEKTIGRSETAKSVDGDDHHARENCSCSRPRGGGGGGGGGKARKGGASRGEIKREVEREVERELLNCWRWSGFVGKV